MKVLPTPIMIFIFISVVINRRAKILVSRVVEDAGGATNMPVCCFINSKYFA